MQKIKAFYKHDTFFNGVIKILKGEEVYPTELRTVINTLELRDGLPYFGYFEKLKDRLVIPTKELQYEIMRTDHSSKTVGHSSINRMYAKIARIVDITTDEKGVESLLLIIDGCSIVDPVRVSTVELKKIISSEDLNVLRQRYTRNRIWLRNNVGIVS